MQIEVRSQKSEVKIAYKSKSKKFEDLLVWQKSHQLVLDIYKLSITFPKNETYGLTSQIRRAAVSIPANIAEGYKRRTKADKLRFMNIAQASLEEVRYYLILINELKYADTTVLKKKLVEVSKILNAYIKVIIENKAKCQKVGSKKGVLDCYI